MADREPWFDAQGELLSATEKSVALVTNIHGPMDQPCPVCRGGWWYDDAEIVFAVHNSECPWKDASERAIREAANSHSEAKGD